MKITKATLHVAASALILLGLAFLVLGLRGTPLLWQSGLAVVAVAMVLSLATRWAPKVDTANPKGRGAYEESISRRD